MYDILIQLINQITKVIEIFFSFEIPFFNDSKISLGMLLLTIAFVIIAIILLFNALGIKFGGDDD